MFQMELFAVTASTHCATVVLSLGVTISAVPSAPSKRLTKKAERVLFQLRGMLAEIDRENDAYEEVYFEESGAETRDDPDMETLGRRVIGRSLLDIFEQQTADDHRLCALQFVFSRIPGHVEVRNLWCRWAGIHPAKLVDKVRKRIVTTPPTRKPLSSPDP